MITVEILADSINPAGNRITTGLWTYPRFIHSEIMTHRMLVKNSASSRAIPVTKMIQAIRDNPAMFEQYGRANKGMEAQELMEDGEIAAFEDAWKEAGKACAEFASDWGKDTAKQIVNRILEPWMHMTVVITGTDWHNFFALRANHAAQPEFQVLAYRWLDAYLKSEPVRKEWGEWHLPITSLREQCVYPTEALLKISTARCARTSYTNHDKVYDVPKDFATHDGLLKSGHMSPTEHQAQACDYAKVDGSFAAGQAPTPYYGCFQGWKPYRKFLPNENRTNVDLHRILADKPEWIKL